MTGLFVIHARLNLLTLIHFQKLDFAYIACYFMDSCILYNSYTLHIIFVPPLKPAVALVHLCSHCI